MSDAEIAEQRKKKLETLQAGGWDPYPHKFDYTHTVGALQSHFGAITAEELAVQAPMVRSCGRLVSLRGHGKTAFGHLSDGSSRVQIYVRQDGVSTRTFQLFELLDVGDFIGVQGKMFRTRTGELTVLVEEVDLLSKCLLPLPEKWHGLTDVETRYRHRYVDLIANPEVSKIFRTRAAVVREMRRFFDERDYIEVETPMMQPMAGGAAAKPFETFHNALGIPLYLRIAPELYLKRLIVGGFPRVYEINRNFRNEGLSAMHNPEFTMLEFYQAYSDYNDLMELTEELLAVTAKTITGSDKVRYKDQDIDFSSCRRFSLCESILHFWNLPAPRPAMEDLRSAEELRRLLRTADIPETPSMGAGALLGQLFETVVEDQLIQPTIIYDYPAETSPLSKTRDDDPGIAERFELFIAGIEIANAYSELNDPGEQRCRFEDQLKKRAAGDQEAHAMDEDYIRALSYGMPPTAGEGIGIDRLTMILTNSHSIREVILFPHLRPEEG